MAIGSRLIIRGSIGVIGILDNNQLANRPSNNLRKFLFFILFFKAQARIFMLKRTSSMIHEPRTSDLDKFYMEHGSGLFAA